MLNKRKGYRVERNVRLMFEKGGWVVMRAGSSLGEADLICLKKGKCLLLQIKSTRKKSFYYYGYMNSEFEGFPFFLVIDFGYGDIRILKPQKKVEMLEGTGLKYFLDTYI
jgi:Holliday junction resolvase